MKNSHAGTPGTPFCGIGGHIVDPATTWTLVRMSLTSETRSGRYRQDENGKWYRDPPAVWIKDTESALSILVCSEHLIDTEISQ